MPKTRSLVAAHVILALTGALLVAIGAILSGASRDALLAIGTSLVATPIVSGLLRFFAGDPLGDVQEELASLTQSLREVNPLLRGGAETGLREVHPLRGDVEGRFPGLARGARQRIWLLAYAMEFLTDSPAFLDALTERCGAGLDVRILLADPTGVHVQSRHGERHQSVDLASRVAESARVLAASCPAAEIRVYDAPLYASVYLFDDDLLLCPALYGGRGAQAPVFVAHQGSLVSQYADHFSRIWDSASIPSA